MDINYQFFTFLVFPRKGDVCSKFGFKKKYFYCSSFVFIAKHNKYISAFLK